MADPTKFTPSYDFSDYQASNPSTPLPGDQVDIQLQAVKTALDSAVDAVKDVRRSDGALKNGVVTADSLASSLVIGFTLRGNWTDDTAYMAGDGVIYDEIFYKSLVAHTSAVETRPDLDQDTWEFLTSMASISITDGSLIPAKLASGQEDGFLAKIGVWAKLGSLISGGTGKATPIDADTLALSDSEDSNASKKLTWANLKAGIWTALGALIAGGTGKTTPVDADTLPLSDSAASNASKKLTWANLKATLLAYFATVFPRYDAAQSLNTTQQGQARTNINAASAAVLPTQGRLTLTSGVSVPESDVVGATAVYLTPTGVNAQPIYDGTVWQDRPFSEMTLTLNAAAHPTAKLFDAFVAWQSGAMILGTGPDWSIGGGTLTARGAGAGSTEIELFQGRWVNKNAIVLKNDATTYASVPARQATLVGWFATVAAAQTTDAANKRWVGSVNGVERMLRMADELTASWPYSTASFRQWNASIANEISWFQGLGGRMVQVEGNAFATTSGATARFGMMGIGIDSATVNSAIGGGGGGLVSLTTAGAICPARYRGHPGIGIHYAAALERGGGTDTQTFFGVQANFPVGMQGETVL